jgi:hypothetical protein
VAFIRVYLIVYTRPLQPRVSSPFTRDTLLTWLVSYLIRCVPESQGEGDVSSLTIDSGLDVESCGADQQACSEVRKPSSFGRPPRADIIKQELILISILSTADLFFGAAGVLTDFL